MTPSVEKAILPELGRIVGDHHLLHGGDLAAWEVDWRQRGRGRALAVVQPANTEEVAAVVRLCAQTRTAIVPQGGNTGLALGSTPDASGTQLVLSTRRLKRIRALDPANATLTAEAGCILQQVQEHAAKVGFLFPLSLAAKGSCTLGGNLATNAGGTQVLHYGNTRQLCLGLEVVTAQGEVWNGLSGLRKDNTGYALRELFVGSEGTLGIITAATMKLEPLPAARLAAWAALPSLQAAVDLLHLARQQLGPALTGFEAMNQFALSLVAKHYPQLRIPFLHAAPWHVLLENSDHESPEHATARFEALLERALADGLVSDVVVPGSLEQSGQLWEVRETITLAQAREGLNIKHDISVPISRIPAFVASTDAQLQQAVPGVRIVNFGHLGDGNLHYNVQAPEGADGPGFLREQEARINAIVFDAVAHHEGSISAEHGIGSFKAAALPRYKSPVALAMMCSIKAALDPLGIMNPGRILASPAPSTVKLGALRTGDKTPCAHPNP